jgi:monoamine oxidase
MDYIIVGAGAAGLMAARKLVSANHHVKVLEARDRIGGRIYTNQPEGFSHLIEGGAEFLHGEVPLTQALCKEANVRYTPLEGTMYRVEKGQVCKDDFFENEWKTLLEELESLKQDKPLGVVLNEKFPSSDDEHFKNNIRRFVEGYSAADIDKVSALALRKEWGHDDDPTQYRPSESYGRLMDFLRSEIEKRNGQVNLNAVVESIAWNKHGAVATTSDGSHHEARKILITAPVGVLRSNSIQFLPEPVGLREAYTNIGFGSVIKIVIEFTQPFWRNDGFRKFDNLDFLFTDAVIPTWWTQSKESNVLTGWVGGPDLENVSHPDETYLKLSIESLAYCFDCPAIRLSEKIKAWKVFQWLNDPYSKGAYTYAKPETASAIRHLTQSFENTLYFAGEAIYRGTHTGTVEAALVSGRDAADRMMR